MVVFELNEANVGVLVMYLTALKAAVEPRAAASSARALPPTATQATVRPLNTAGGNSGLRHSTGMASRLGRTATLQADTEAKGPFAQAAVESSRAFNSTLRVLGISRASVVVGRITLTHSSPSLRPRDPSVL
jgi:hypothetical protein